MTIANSIAGQSDWHFGLFNFSKYHFKMLVFDLKGCGK